MPIPWQAQHIFSETTRTTWSFQPPATQQLIAATDILHRASTPAMATNYYSRPSSKPPHPITTRTPHLSPSRLRS
jgi:hypothetical protein